MPPPLDTAGWDDILSTARSYQYDVYLAATLAPRRHRADLLLLAAFAGEMARIATTVGEPTIAAIRLQWWRDALAAAADQRSGNPLADALRDAVTRHGLPVGLLIGHIDAQELELYADLADDLHALEIHFAKRDGALFNLAARILGAAPTGDEAEAVAAGARAYGLARSLAEFAWRQPARQLLVPRDRADAHGVAPGQALDAAGIAAARPLIAELADAARHDLATFRHTRHGRRRALRTALLPVALTETYLAFAERQFDAAKTGETGPSRLTRSWRLLLAHCTARL